MASFCKQAVEMLEGYLHPDMNATNFLYQYKIQVSKFSTEVTFCGDKNDDAFIAWQQTYFFSECEYGFGKFGMRQCLGNHILAKQPCTDAFLCC